MCRVWPTAGFFGMFGLFYTDHAGDDGSVLDVVAPFVRVPRAEAVFAFCGQVCWDAFVARARSTEGA